MQPQRLIAMATAAMAVALPLLPGALAAAAGQPGKPSPAARPAAGEIESLSPAPEAAVGPLEVPDDPFLEVPLEARTTTPARRWLRGGHASVQVNVDALGNNIVGDAANEPSIAVDPTDPGRIAVGWRQFDTVASNFRQAGWSHSGDGGLSWAAMSVIEPGIFRSDPVLDADAGGNFYYYSLSTGGGFSCETFKSADGGASWGGGVFAFGGDKAWLAVDRTGGLGAGHLYGVWSPTAGCCGSDQFNRSVDGGASFEAPVAVSGQPTWGVNTVGPDGEVYAAGRLPTNFSQFVVAKSTTVQDPGQALAFDFSTPVDLGGSQVLSAGPNPGGLLGQVWVAVDPSPGPRHGWVYVVSSVDPPGSDPLDVHFVRSTDGGMTWSAPVRLNGDPAGTDAWQWFGTLSVSPGGRIDVVWADTRSDPGGFDSVLYYSHSVDGGLTWSADQPLSPPFDPHLGWPNQDKIGDYYDMVSDDAGAHLAYTATFNGEQDVYYLHIVPDLVFGDGFESGNTSAWTAAVP